MSNKQTVREENKELLKDLEVIEVKRIPEKLGEIEIQDGFFSTSIKMRIDCIVLSKLEDFVKLYNQYKKESIYYYHLVYDDSDDVSIDADLYFTELSDGRKISYSVVIDYNSS